jgi:hypothetical protein
LGRWGTYSSGEALIEMVRTRIIEKTW